MDVSKKKKSAVLEALFRDDHLKEYISIIKVRIKILSVDPSVWGAAR